MKKAKQRKLVALGITCGIGSMLCAARNAGFEVLGNHEWRKYYHKKDPQGKNTFTENFPGAYFVEEYPQDIFEKGSKQENFWWRVGKVDVVYGHPECGCYSALNFSNKTFRDKQMTKSDIPKFLEAIATVKPRFFVMDDLPRSFLGMPISEYHQILPEYDLFPEWISNYHYGNVQLNRKRMFMIGALKTEKWAFVPGEFEHETTIQDVIGDLYRQDGKGIPNHEQHTLDEACGKIADYYHYGYRGTWRDFQKAMSQRPEGPPITYQAGDGTTKVRCGTAKVRWEGHGFVLDGGSVCTHPLTNLPLSIRERARIQGFPDSFVFYGVKLDRKGRWNHDKNNDLVKQTGKAMPLQFNEYVGRQIRAHILGEKFEASNERFVDENGLVNDAKRWFCQEVGYSNQKATCAACWMRNRCELPRFAGDRSVRPVQVVRRVASSKEPKKPRKVFTPTVPEGTVFGSISSKED